MAMPKTKMQTRMHKVVKDLSALYGDDISQNLDIDNPASNVGKELEGRLDYIAGKLLKPGSLKTEDAKHVHDLLRFVADFSPELKRRLDSKNLNKDLDSANYAKSKLQEELRQLLTSSMRDKVARNKIVGELRDFFNRINSDEKLQKQFKDSRVYKLGSDVNSELGQAVIGRGGQANYDDFSFIGKQCAYAIRTALTAVLSIVEPSLLPDVNEGPQEDNPFMKQMALQRKPPKGHRANTAGAPAPAAAAPAPIRVGGPG
jgi:hypothetical protein